jgi:hypothetical protein
MLQKKQPDDRNNIDRNFVKKIHWEIVTDIKTFISVFLYKNSVHLLSTFIIISGDIFLSLSLFSIL